MTNEMSSCHAPVDDVSIAVRACPVVQEPVTGLANEHRKVGREAAHSGGIGEDVLQDQVGHHSPRHKLAECGRDVAACGWLVMWEVVGMRLCTRSPDATEGPCCA